MVVRMLGAIWGFTRPFERISRFWRIDFIPKPQKSAYFENRVKSDSRRLHHPFNNVLSAGPVFRRAPFGLHSSA